MRFVDISVDQFGVLENSQLGEISPGMTVVGGGNGSGKTTLVSFLRGLLFGYTTDHEAFQPDDRRFGGSVVIETGGRSCRLARERSHGISSDLSVMDLATGVSVPATTVMPSRWINETVYREIFSVGDQEAVRFDLLTRLCLDVDADGETQDEIRRTQLAIDQSIREREGEGPEIGLRQTMSSLRQQKEVLARELSDLRRTAPETPARIAEVEAEIRRLRTTVADLDEQIMKMQTEIQHLEERLEILRRRNVVRLDRQAIEEEIARLVQRQRHWTNIRETIQHELSLLSAPATVKLDGVDSLKSIRALVSRLEQRMDSVGGEGTVYGQLPTESDREVLSDHIRSEVFSLCDYVRKHESAIAIQEVSLEALLARRAQQDVENLNTVLQGRIDGLREELHRSEDVIGSIPSRGAECNSHSHSSYRRVAERDHSERGTVGEVEANLLGLRRRLNDLKTEQSSISGRLRSLEGELTELRSQIRTAPGLADVDRLKTAMADIDARLELQQSRWTALERTESNLRSVLQRLEQYRNPQVLEIASEYIERLTEGDCYQLSTDPDSSQIVATTRQSSRPQTLQHLSRGTREQVALALRLALIQYRADESERCPLILDDVFITTDDGRGEAVADLLMEVADSGQQIIFFTCQNEVSDLFAERGASIRRLEPRPVAVQQPAPQPLPMLSIPSPPPPAPVPSPVSESTNWLFYLEVDNSVEDLSGLTVAEVEAFRASQIETIDQLLTISVDDLETRFRDHGYAISRDRIRAWRGQAELATQVPMLRRSDAELLFAAGIQTTVELSRMRPETVYDSVVAFQESQPGTRYRRSGRPIDRQQAINWSRWSQHARSLSAARQSRSRYFVRTSDQHNSPADAARRARSGTGGVSSRRARISQTGTTLRRQQRPRLSADARRQRKDRQSRRKERLARHSSSYRTSLRSDDEKTDTERELRFHLNRSDDVEAAPSIGPRTAQRLGTVGIYTVDDLLSGSAVDIANRLDNRRITADTIQQWQAQARLVCQIPELRGHDSQILVACGVTDPEQLSAKRPIDLMAIVGPFADTSEGERIVRGGRKPDLEEVTDWIRWAQQSRSLKAAA